MNADIIAMPIRKRIKQTFIKKNCLDNQILIFMLMLNDLNGTKINTMERAAGLLEEDEHQDGYRSQQ